MEKKASKPGLSLWKKKMINIEQVLGSGQETPDAAEVWERGKSFLLLKKFINVILFLVFS